MNDLVVTIDSCIKDVLTHSYCQLFRFSCEIRKGSMCPNWASPPRYVCAVNSNIYA